MIPLLVWLAGCAFGIWTIMHYGFYREAAAFAVTASVLFWIVGGAGWLAKRIQDGAARSSREADGLRKSLSHTEQIEREQLKRAAEQAAATRQE